MENALQVENLCKSYPNFTLSNISLTLERGKVMGFVGRNGAGKTTTIKMIMGLIKPSSGTIKIFGNTGDDKKNIVREHVGFVYDEPGFIGGMTIRGIGNMTRPFYKKWNQDEFVRRAAEFKLDLNRRIQELSQGQKTKLSLIIALSHDAELLIMDEPTSGLDPLFRSELIDILYQILEDDRKAILFSTHLTSDLDRIADYITFIDGGHLLFSETKESIRDCYRKVTGPRSILTEKARKHCIGIRETKDIFEAITHSENEVESNFDTCVKIESASLEDVMVHTLLGIDNE